MPAGRRTAIIIGGGAVVASSAWAVVTIAGDDRAVRTGETTIVATTVPATTSSTVVAGVTPSDPEVAATTQAPDASAGMPAAPPSAGEPAPPAEPGAATPATAPATVYESPDDSGELPLPGLAVPPTFLVEEDTTEADAVSEALQEAQEAFDRGEYPGWVEEEPFEGPPDGTVVPRGNEEDPGG